MKNQILVCLVWLCVASKVNKLIQEEKKTTIDRRRRIQSIRIVPSFSAHPVLSSWCPWLVNDYPHYNLKILITSTIP